jgi:hypothetical protein
MDIVNSTVSSNTAYAGGGILNDIQGTATMANITISGNSANIGAGGGLLNAGSLTIVNSTFSDNSSSYDQGVCNEGMLDIGSTILNGSASGVSILNGGTSTSLGYNLSSDPGSGVLNQMTDQTNTGPMLGPLQDNGGPTFTHALLYGSPAIDKGRNFAGSPYDQRGPGFARTFDDPFVPNAVGGDGTDIGAFEVQSPWPREIIDNLITVIETSSLPTSRVQPLIASLQAALAAIGHNNPDAAVNELLAFQQEVRVQVRRFDPTLAQQLIADSQFVIDEFRMQRTK